MEQTYLIRAVWQFAGTSQKFPIIWLITVRELRTLKDGVSEIRMFICEASPGEEEVRVWKEALPRRFFSGMGATCLP